MDQKKLTNARVESSLASSYPHSAYTRLTSFAPATSMRAVPWDTTEFIASEDVDDYVRRKLNEMRLGTFFCREDGDIELITMGSAVRYPWSCGEGYSCM